MFGLTEDSKTYWNKKSQKFANYYEKPSKFDLTFRKGIFRRFEISMNLCNSISNPTILDIGSGPGINSVNLIKHANVLHVTGIDFAPNMVKFSKKYATEHGLADKSEFIEGDFMDYDFKSQKFDVVLALGVFDYINNPQEFILKMSSMTRVGFVISWPSNGLRMFLRKIRYDCPVYSYNRNDIQKYHSACKSIKSIEYNCRESGCTTVALMNHNNDY